MTLGALVDVVADTSVLVPVFTDRADQRHLANRYRPHLENKAVAISFQTVAELRVQAAAGTLNPTQMRSAVARFEIVPWSEELQECYIRIRAAAIARNQNDTGSLVSPADGWIAAAALLLDRPLVTHDRKLAASPLIETISELDSQS